MGDPATVGHSPLPLPVLSTNPHDDNSGGGALHFAQPSEDDDSSAVATANETPEQHAARLALRGLRSSLSSELEATGQNGAAINESWRRILRLVKAESLRGDVEVIMQRQERDVDRRDARIEMLQRDMEEVAEEVADVVHAHVAGIEGLAEIQASRLEELNAEFERSVRSLEADFAADRANTTARFAAATTELLHVIRAVTESEDSKLRTSQAEYEQQREGTRRRNLEQVHVLQSDMDSTIELVEKEFETAHLQYLQNTDARTADYKVLSERAQHDAQVSERQQRALKKLNRLLQTWRSRTASNTREWEERNEALQREKAQLAKHLDEQKGATARARAAQQARLKKLSNGAQAARDALAEQTALAQRVLGAMESVRKLQSVQEKVLGAGAAAEQPPAEAGDLKGPQASGAEADAAQIARSLRAFHGTYNAALYEMLELEGERDRLRAESRQLSGLMGQFLRGSSLCPEDTESADSLLKVSALGGRPAAGDGRRRSGGAAALGEQQPVAMIMQMVGVGAGGPTRQ